MSLSFLENLTVHNMKSVMTAAPGWRVSRYRAVKIYSFDLFIWVYLVSLVWKEHEREAAIRTGNRGTVEPPLNATSLQRPLSSVTRASVVGRFDCSFKSSVPLIALSSYFRSLTARSKRQYLLTKITEQTNGGNFEYAPDQHHQQLSKRESFLFGILYQESLATGSFGKNVRC